MMSECPVMNCNLCTIRNDIVKGYKARSLQDNENFIHSKHELRLFDESLISSYEECGRNFTLFLDD